MRLSSKRLCQLFLAGCDLAGFLTSWYVTVLILGPVQSHDSGIIPAAHLSAFLLLAVLGFWTPLAVSLRVYERKGREPRPASLFRATQGVILAISTALIALVLFGGMDINLGREYMKWFLPIACMVLCLGRYLGSKAAAYASSRWPLQPYAALVAEQVDSLLVDQLRKAGSAVLKGMIVSSAGSGKLDAQPLRVLGTTRELAAVINRERLDQLVLLNGAVSELDATVCDRISKRMGVALRWALAMPEGKSNVSFFSDFGLHFLELTPVRFSRWDRFAKRLLDFVFALSAIIFLAPVLTVVAGLVKLSSRGPILYRAPRVGQGGRYFTFLKFRTMYAGSTRRTVEAANEKDGHLFKMHNDPRVTPLGRFLRRYSLDELPQLFNVLAGQMSLVGPRPLPIEDLDPDGLSSRFATWSEQRASVPPGITGLWQIRGRSDLSFSDLINYDLEYVHNWSLGLDFSILVRTPTFVLSGKGAY